MVGVSHIHPDLKGVTQMRAIDFTPTNAVAAFVMISPRLAVPPGSTAPGVILILSPSELSTPNACVTAPLTVN